MNGAVLLGAMALLLPDAEPPPGPPCRIASSVVVGCAPVGAWQDAAENAVNIYDAVGADPAKLATSNVAAVLRSASCMAFKRERVAGWSIRNRGFLKVARLAAWRYAAIVELRKPGADPVGADIMLVDMRNLAGTCGKGGAPILARAEP